MDRAEEPRSQFHVISRSEVNLFYLAWIHHDHILKTWTGQPDTQNKQAGSEIGFQCLDDGCNICLSVPCC